MKQKIITILLFISISSSSLFAITVEEFADNIAYSVFKTAWPTAEYKNTEVLQQKITSSGYTVVLKFNGNSNFCIIGDCPLWFKLEINADSNFNIQEMEVLDYQSILAKPFETIGSIGKAIQEANNQ